jgi:hypothetical protein
MHILKALQCQLPQISAWKHKTIEYLLQEIIRRHTLDLNVLYKINYFNVTHEVTSIAALKETDLIATGQCV